MLNIDWRKTLTLLSLLILVLAMAVYFFRPSDAELEARAGQTASKTSLVPVEEKAQFSFDERVWQIAREVKQDNKYSADYLPQGDALPDWKEIVTIQTFGSIQDKGTPEEFALAMKKHFTDWGGDKLVWNMISASDSDCIYQWQITGKEKFADQYEMVRIIKGNEGFHLIHYAKRTTVIDEKEREQWLQRLMAAKVVFPDEK